MSVKHTPGKWRVIKRSNQTGIRYLFVDTNTQQGGVWEPTVKGPLTDQNLADALLIAAAPELLATLKELEAQMLLWTDSDLNGLMPRVRAAILKAEGGAA